MRDRARVTVTNVVYTLLALAALAALWPVLEEMIRAAAPILPEGQELVFASLLPIAITVILGVIYVEAITGR